MSKKPPVYQLRVSLEELRPMIWRRVLVPADLRLDRLHEVFQAIMGWEDYHLHMFTAGKVQYGLPDDELPDVAVLEETNTRSRTWWPRRRPASGTSMILAIAGGTRSW